MNGQWTVVEDVKQLPRVAPSDHHGYVYAVQYGPHIKIGMSSNLLSRISAIKSHAMNYASTEVGRIAHTPAHTNYAENEKALHLFFAEKRSGGSELFGLSLNEFVTQSPLLELEDRSAEMSQRADQFVDFMKGVLLGCRKPKVEEEQPSSMSIFDWCVKHELFGIGQYEARKAAEYMAERLGRKPERSSDYLSIEFKVSELKEFFFDVIGAYIVVDGERVDIVEHLKATA
jgi:hypothetical protein